MRDWKFTLWCAWFWSEAITFPLGFCLAISPALTPLWCFGTGMFLFSVISAPLIFYTGTSTPSNTCECE